MKKLLAILLLLLLLFCGAGVYFYYQLPRPEPEICIQAAANSIYCNKRLVTSHSDTFRNSAVRGALLAYESMRIPELTFIYNTENCKHPQNPSQGLYMQIDSSRYEEIGNYANRLNLFLIAFNIYNYRSGEIPADKLNELAACLQTAKDHQVKCIIRPAYGFDKHAVNDAASMEILETHIGQIAPVLNQYKNQVLCVQAGFLGPWGEWHSSTYLQGDEALANRNHVLQLLVDNLDEKLPICVRRPSFIRDAVDAGMDIHRFGFFNDGLLGSESDLGTYAEADYGRNDELSWINTQLAGNPVGGEMPYYNSFAEAANADKDFDMLNISYLNKDYNTSVLNKWKKTQLYDVNAYDYIIGNLGYRIKLTSVSYPERIYDGILEKGQQLSITLSNEGYGNIPYRYKLDWLLETEEHGTVILASDAALYSLGTGKKLTISLDAETLRQLGVTKVSIRISEKDETAYTNQNCIELLNPDIEYREGASSILHIKEEGLIEIDSPSSFSY